MPHWKYLLLASLTLMPVPAMARVWEVGPGRELTLPSQAAAVVQDGDIVRIDAGQYVDCAVWRADHLLIEGPGSGQGEVVVRNQVCQDKAIFVTAGAAITIRNITFRHARASSWNGAGIRAEGADLTVQDSHFIDNENGILSAPNPASHIVIRDSSFMRNGSCQAQAGCAHGIYAGQIASLQIFHSTFFQQYAGHHIKSRAQRTELVGNNIQDGERGTASFAVDIADGGSLILKDNVIEKGPRAINHLAAVSIGGESTRNGPGELTIADNRFTNDNANQTSFVLNRTASPAALSGNRLRGKAVALTGPGTVAP